MVLRGERLDRPTYSVIQTILEGNTAICYKSWHDIFDCWCVQKTISLLGVTDALAYQEPQLLRSLRHPHLTEIWEAQWDPDYGDKAVTFTMPYYEGGSLHAAMMEGRRFSIGEAVKLTCDILDALHFLHVERRIVHRDVKPGNIFLSADATTAYLGDLGCAAPIEKTRSIFSGGTLLYRAPEATSTGYTARSDLYSVALVLLEMLGRRFPYEDLDQDDIRRRLQERKCPLPGRYLRVPVHVPDALARIIKKLLNPDPNSRPASALEVQRALENVAHLNWRQTSADEPKIWIGEVLLAGHNRPPRDVEVRARTLSRGPDSGKIELSARWRARNALLWRRMGKLSVQVSAEDQTAWRSFFKSVETALLHTAARR